MNTHHRITTPVTFAKKEMGEKMILFRFGPYTFEDGETLDFTGLEDIATWEDPMPVLWGHTGMISKAPSGDMVVGGGEVGRTAHPRPRQAPG